MKLPISQIKSNPNNPRTIRDDNFKKLVQSLKDFPEMADVREIVVNKDHVILGGNMRFKAMKEAGWTEAPVKIVDWPEDKQREFIIKDNVSGGEWDWDNLANDWDAELLDSWGLDLPGGFGDEEVEEDEAPEVDDSELPKSELGKIYQLGKHRVMCGDSTVKENIDSLLNGKTPFMVLTDPPYGMNLDTDYSKRNTPGKKDYNGLGTKYGTRGKYSAVIGDDKDYDPSHIFEHFADVKEMFLWGADYYSDLIPNRTDGSWYSWDKRVGIEEIKFTASEFELCWSKKKHLREIIRVRWFGAHGTQTQDEKKRSHPTQKPIEVNTFFIQKFSKGKEDIIVDLFLGTGSCLIACEQTDRTCYGVEIDPKYVDVIRKRYWKYTHDNDEDGWEVGTPNVT